MIRGGIEAEKHAYEHSVQSQSTIAIIENKHLQHGLEKPKYHAAPSDASLSTKCIGCTAELIIRQRVPP